jgi:hypothetical protein
MMKKRLVFLAAVLSGIAFADLAAAADVMRPTDPAKPVTTTRVGGSPADAAFRDAQQKSGAAYRAARDACRVRPREERSACLTEAKAQLKQARLEAKAAHDAAKKSR